MKKIFIILAILCSYVASAQPGYTNINNRYNWLAGIFRALGLPSGDSAQFTTGQAQRQGAVYMDTVNTPESPNGLYVYEDPTGGNSPFWNRQATAAQICQNRLLTEWNVSWQGSGFNYTVHGGLSDGTGSYQIGCSFYTADSATATFDPADPDEDRIDIIYLDATGVHVRAGDLAAPGTAVRPTVDVDEILLTEVLVAAGATSPTLTQLIVYNENTESVVTNTGTTTNGANVTFVYIGSLSTNVTGITHNDQIFFTKEPPASTWNVLGFDGLSLAVHLKATMPTNANLGVALQVGTTTVGTEVIVPLVRTNSTTYQQISIPISAFGNMSNTNITRVRFRYIRPASGASYTGFYLDYIYFVDGMTGPPGSTATFTFNPPTGFSVTPSNTQQSPGTWTMAASGALPGQYYTVSGWVTLPEFVNAMGALDGRTKTAEGATIDGNELFLQTVDADDPGLATSEMYTRIFTNYYISNAGDGDTLAFPLNDSTTGIKSVKGIGGIVITSTDTTVIWDGSGIGGSSLLPVTGTGTATGDVFGDLDNNDLSINDANAINLSANATGGTNFIQLNNGSDNLIIKSDLGSDESSLTLFGDIYSMISSSGTYLMSNLNDDLAATKVMVWNAGSIGTQDISGLGGGGITQEQSEDFTGAMFATDNGDIDFTYNDGTPDIAASYKAGSIIDADINGSAAIDATKIADGSVTSSEFQFINTLSSNAQTQIDAKAPLASPTFTGTVTIPTPFTLGATSVTTTGTQLNYLNAATGTTGTTSTNLVFSAGPTFTGTTSAATLNVSGFATLSGGFATNVTAGNSNMYVTAGVTANRSTTASLLPLSAAGIGARAFINGTTAYTMTASDAFATLDIGTTGGVTEAASGTHPIVASLVVRPITVTNGAGATDILAGLYVEGPATGVTPVTASYGLWLDAGTARLDGNVLIGGTTAAASATTSLHLFNGTIPSASVTDGVVLYSEDVTSSAELKVRDEATNVTTLSPHNFSGIPEGRSEEMAWSFYSERDGKYINVDMLKLARLVEKISGVKLVYIGETKTKIK